MHKVSRHRGRGKFGMLTSCLWQPSKGQLGPKRLKTQGVRLSKPEFVIAFSGRRSALSAVRPGGVVVYSTCTLSSAENYSVVETLLKESPEAEPEDLWEELALPLSKYFAFNPAGAGHDTQTLHKPSLQPRHGRVSSYQHRLGILVVPQPGRTWGPMFLSRIRRTGWGCYKWCYKSHTLQQQVVEWQCKDIREYVNVSCNEPTENSVTFEIKKKKITVIQHFKGTVQHFWLWS